MQRSETTMDQLNGLRWRHLRALILISMQSICFAGRHEDRLINDLFMVREYNPYARPVRNESEAVEVTFGISLQSIVNVDEKTEMLHTNMWLDYTWVDYKLTWNASEYGDVQSIRLPSGKIWTPDILMYNSADEDIDSKYPTNVVVYSDGKCSWVPLGLYISSCSINIRWFPFDDQYCMMKFGSWTYDGSQINLTAGSQTIDLTTYVVNGEWEVLEVPAVRSAVRYECCPNEFQDITFTIHIRRRTLYYGFNLIIPCALISFLALFTFTLPPDTNAKVGLGITILLSLSVFQLIVAETVPATSISVPLVGIYFACVMVMCTISLIVTIVVLRFHHQKPEMTAMSPFVQKYICGWLAWLLRMSRPGHKPSAPRIQEKQTNSSGSDIGSSVAPSALSEVIATDKQSVQPKGDGQPGTVDETTIPPFQPGHGPKLQSAQVQERPCPAHGTPLSRARNELQAILNELRFITRKIREEDEGSEEMSQWKFAAMVIDRLCFWIFTVYLVVATLAIFFSSPNLRATVSGTG